MPIRTAAAAAAAMALVPSLALADPAPGKPILETRLRYERFDAGAYPETADAVTLRLRYGWEGPAGSALRLLVEGESVVSLAGDYSDGVTSKPGLPVVPDPMTTELNRLQATWTGLPNTEVVLGRQRIVLNNGRFVGNAGFRQNEQTFDAARVTTTAVPKLKLTYAYVARVRRPLGDDHPQGEWRGDTHLFQGETKTPAGDLAGYGLLLDLENAPAQSSATWGARLSGSRPTGYGPSWTYGAEYARQGDRGNAPAEFDLDYLALSVGAKTARSSMALGLERLGGDGARGFQTPLASLHPFQGWSDVIGATPAYGLRDLNLRAATSLTAGGRAFKIAGAAHDFRDADDAFAVGRELDLSVSAPLGRKTSVELKGTWFEGRRPELPDATRLWLSLEHRY
ncbi:MAG TPA: hypothetical protein VD929_02090 [Caulobacteraceae bacterium]|nr:hypothetical protein [Caulobacteraceae bacterium]